MTASAGAIALAACSSPPTPVAPVVAPVPKAYACAEQRQAGAEYRALPPGAVLRRLVDDYGELRARLRAVHRMPEPAGCG